MFALRKSFSYRPLGFLTFFFPTFFVSIGVIALTISNYEPLILQRKFGQIRKLKNNVKPTMMPNPRGFFVVNNHKMYADFWTLGRRFQLLVNRGSPAFSDDAPFYNSEWMNDTSPKKKPMTSRDLDFFSGYLDDNPHLEAYGYISTTRNGDETLVFTVNLGTDSLHIENSEYIVDNDNWFNTIAYLRRDVTIKAPNNPRFRSSRHLLHESKPEVVDYYTKIEQYNYSIWENRPLHRQAKACLIYMVSDYSAFMHLGGTYSNVVKFHVYAGTMSFYAYRIHDFDMDGISDNFAFRVEHHMVLESRTGYKEYIKELTDLSNNNDSTRHQWIEGLAYWNSKKNPECGIAGFTVRDSWPIAGGARNAKCCDNASVIVNFHELKTPANAAIIFLHNLAHLIGGKLDPDKCTDSKNNNIKLGKYLSDGSLKTYENVNNLRLSPCAMTDIQKIINDIYNKEKCLKIKEDQFCGNKIREEKEECDCGDQSECANVDKCCVAVDLYSNLTACTIDKDTEHERHEGDKVIKYKYECSPKSHVCCNEDCLTVKKEERKICRPASDCSDSVYCDGNFTCPNSTGKDDGFPCDGNEKACSNGSCKIEICKYNNDSEPCLCDDTKHKCVVCCAKSNNGSSTGCKPLEHKGKTLDRQNGFSCGSGSLCVNGKCQEEATVSTVPNRLQSEDSYESDWYSDYWYLFLIATVILMILITLATAFYKKGHKARKMRNFESHVRSAQERLEGNALLENTSPETKMQASRLLALFPTANYAVVIDTATRLDTENEMVLKMLQNGYPMRRL